MSNAYERLISLCENAGIIARRKRKGENIFPA